MAHKNNLIIDEQQITIVPNPRVNLINKKTNKPKFVTQYYADYCVTNKGKDSIEKVYFIKVTDKRLSEEPFLISVIYFNDMHISSYIRKENNIEYLNKYWKEILSAIIKFRQS